MKPIRPVKIFGIDGGPRRGWNTETMLRKFLEGAASASDEVETEMVRLYDLNYKGCMSCYACQLDNEVTYGQCQVKDDIYDLLRRVPLSDGAVFGCPIYLHDMTAHGHDLHDECDGGGHESLRLRPYPRCC